MSTISFIDVPLEKNRREKIEDGIRKALKLLAEYESLPKIEDSQKGGHSGNNLNRKLYKCFLEICPSCGIDSPRFGAPNPPYYRDDDRHIRENHRPDFYWENVDHTIEGGAWRFVLECKRLGKGNSSWNLNKNYVEKGMKRFVSFPYEYGKGDSASGMVAYIQDMDFDDILSEVNQHITDFPEITSCVPPPITGWAISGISEMVHDLERPFEKKVFTFFHYWVDLRRQFASSR